MSSLMDIVSDLIKLIFQSVIGPIISLLEKGVMFFAGLLGLKGLVSRSGGGIFRYSDTFFSRFSNPLLRGDLVAYAELEYPREKFPTAWTDIPDDLRRPLTWDGRLLNGRRVAELAKSQLTDELVSSVVVRAGLHAASITLLIALFPLAYGLLLGGTASIFYGLTPFPDWAWDNGAMMPVVAWSALTVAEHVGAVLSKLMISGMMLMLFPIIWLWAFASGMSHLWETISNSLRVATRDSEIFWKSNALLRGKQYTAYRREVLQSTTRLMGQPFIPVGMATGTCRGRGDMESPDFDQIIGYDGESIRQHTLILGGTGTGKTRLVIRPLFRRIMEANWGEGHKIGAYITDGKGTLWQDLAPIVAETRKDVAILGTGPDHFGIDLVQGMTPLEVSTTFKAVAGQVNGESTDTFWPESASLLLMHSAMIARALEVHAPTVEAWVKRRGNRPYSLLGIALIASEEPTTKEAFEMIAHILRERGEGFTDEQKDIFTAATQSKDWLQNSFMTLAATTKGSIIANVSAVLGKLSGAPEISHRFCSGAFDPKKMVDVDHALNGGIVMIAVGETEHGMAGKVVTVWLKTRLYILARRRMVVDPTACEKMSCAMFADEFQMLATTGPDSDTSFWNIGRQSGLFMAGAASQSLSALQQAIGPQATANLLDLMSSKIILKTNDKATKDYAREMAGEVARGWEYETGLYSTQATRHLAFGSLQEWTADDIEISGISGLWPSRYTPSNQPFRPYNAGAVAGMFKAPRQNYTADQALSGALPQTDVAEAQNAQQMAMREEDKNRDAMIGSLQIRPVLDGEELLLGSGFAFAVIQRAGGKRIDIIDLEFEE